MNYEELYRSLVANQLRLIEETRRNARIEYWSGNGAQAVAMDFMCKRIEDTLRNHGVEVPIFSRGVGDYGCPYVPFHFRVIGPVAMSVA